MKKATLLIGAFLIAVAVNGTAGDIKEVWEKQCASCHGKDGKGQTKAGKKAGVKDLTDAKYQETFTDEKMLKQIKEGMKDPNGKEQMKPFRDKLTEEEMKALIVFVRSLKPG